MPVIVNIDGHNGGVVSDQVIAFFAGQAINFDISGGEAILYRRLRTDKPFVPVSTYQEGAYSDIVSCFCEMKFVFSAGVSVTLAR